MIYLFIGILTFWYFYKLFKVPIFVKSKKTTALNLGVVIIMILLWPVFIITKIVLRVRGEE